MFKLWMQRISFKIKQKYKIMSIKLEAFFKIPTQYLEYTVEKNICDNGHFVKRNDCYCSVCGKKTIIKSVVSMSPLSISDILAGDGTNYCDDEFDVVFSNDDMYVFSERYNDYSIDVDNNTVITPELIEDNINYFSEKYKEIIKLLEEKMNLKIKVQFGYFPEY